MNYKYVEISPENIKDDTRTYAIVKFMQEHSKLKINYTKENNEKSTRNIEFVYCAKSNKGYYINVIDLDKNEPRNLNTKNIEIISEL